MADTDFFSDLVGDSVNEGENMALSPKEMFSLLAEALLEDVEPFTLFPKIARQEPQFDLFKKLPTEVRLMIWNFARPRPRYLELRTDRHISWMDTQKISVSQPSRKFTQANKESLSETLRYCSTLKPTKHMEFGAGRVPLSFDSNTDVLYISRSCSCGVDLRTERLFRGFFRALTRAAGQRVRTLAFDSQMLGGGVLRRLMPKDQGFQDFDELLIVVGKGVEERQHIVTSRKHDLEGHIEDQLRELIGELSYRDDLRNLYQKATITSLMLLVSPEKSRTRERFYRAESWKILQAEGKVPIIKIMIMAEPGLQTFE